MATLKQRQKAELKALNVECETRLAGKKGPERDAELKAIEALKRAMQEKHERELKEDEERLAAETEAKGTSGAEEEEDTINKEEKSAAEIREKKLSKARQKALKKEAKEEEEKRKRQEEAAKKGPSKRDIEMINLLSALSRMNMKIKDINPDGNCMFSAVSHQIKVYGGPEMSTQELRQQAVKAIRGHPAMFSGFMLGEETLESHCNKLLKDGEWGGEIELRALSLALQRQIWVHTMSNVIKWGEDEGFDPETALHLTYHQYQFGLGEHYNSAVPKDVPE